MKSIVIMTHLEDGHPKLPHLDHARASNPDATIHVAVGEDSPLGKRDNWKNSDRSLRKWWTAHRDTVPGDVVFVCEWDTLIGVPVPELPVGVDLAGRDHYEENVELRTKCRGCRRTLQMAHPEWTPDHWMWWPEMPRLGLPPDTAGVGLVSFGAYLMRREVLDALIDPKWDAAFAASVQNELRFPTLASVCGFTVGSIDLPFVFFDDTNVFSVRGIYHSVDAPVPMDFWDHESN